MCENQFKNSEEKKRREDFNRLFAAAAAGIIKAIRDTAQNAAQNAKNV